MTGVASVQSFATPVCRGLWRLLRVAPSGPGACGSRRMCGACGRRVGVRLMLAVPWGIAAYRGDASKYGVFRRVIVRE